MRPSNANIEHYLNLYPEVRWDRFIEQDDDFTIYGWIDREDGRSDFMIWIAEDVPGRDGWEQWQFTTSSAKWSKEFSRRLDTGNEESNHTDCQRVEDLGLNVRAISIDPQEVNAND